MPSSRPACRTTTPHAGAMMVLRPRSMQEKAQRRRGLRIISAQLWRTSWHCYASPHQPPSHQTLASLSSTPSRHSSTRPIPKLWTRKGRGRKIPKVCCIYHIIYRASCGGKGVVCRSFLLPHTPTCSCRSSLLASSSYIHNANHPNLPLQKRTRFWDEEIADPAVYHRRPPKTGRNAQLRCRVAQPLCDEDPGRGGRGTRSCCSCQRVGPGRLDESRAV